MQQIYLLAGRGTSVREIARTLRISRNSVRKYLRAPEVPVAKPRAPRPSLLDPYKDYVRVRLAVRSRATRPGQRLTIPGQWAGLPTADGHPRREALASQVPTVQVQQRSLAFYEELVGAAVGLYEVVR